MKKPSAHSTSSSSESSFSKMRIPGLIFILLLLGFFIWQMSRPPESGEKIKEQPAQSVETPGSSPVKPAPKVSLAAGNLTAPVAGTALIPKPMEMNKKMFFRKKWNSAEDALTRMEPPNQQEGGTMGPHSVAYADGITYVLDSVANYLKGYDKNGKMVSSLHLPNTRLPADLVVDPTDSSLFVIDQYEQKIYKAKGDKLTLLGDVPLREFSLGEKFGYDAPSGTLYISSPERAGDVAVMINGQVVDSNQRKIEQFSPAAGDFQEGNRNNLLLNLRGGQQLTVTFETPILAVQEVATDRKGIVWVLYALQGDYRTFHVARVDPVKQTVGTFTMDYFYWAYDSVRHMATTDNGVVLLGGDKEEGRMFSLEYTGDAL